MPTRRRFALPVLFAGLIGVGASAPALASGSHPHLPRESAQQLVAGVLAGRTSAVSGSLAWSPDLGLPSLSGLTTGGQGVPSSTGVDPTSLLTTSQTFRLWVDGSKERIATTGALAETDVLRNGRQAWVWNSATQHVDHYTFTEATGGAPAAPPAGVDPQTIAAQAIRQLEAAGTSVTVGRLVDVAGVPAQVLQLRPTDQASSTVSSVDIAVDAANSAVLQVSINAVGQDVPALQLGFTSVRFAPPASSVFAPPQGATTSNHVVTPQSLHPQQPRSGWYGYAPLTQSSPAPARPPVRTIGHGWSTVLEVSPSGRGGHTLAALETAARPVSGTWGSGRLLHSSLLDALVLPSGHVLVGFVPPAVLEADAATLGG